MKKEKIEFSPIIGGALAERVFISYIKRKGLKIFKSGKIIECVGLIFRWERKERKEKPGFKYPAEGLNYFLGARGEGWKMNDEEYNRLRRFVRRKGYSERKLQYWLHPTNRFPYKGIPDYFIVNPRSGKCWFVEIKSNKAELKPIQKQMVRELKSWGFQVRLYRLKISYRAQIEKIEL